MRNPCLLVLTSALLAGVSIAQLPGGRYGGRSNAAKAPTATGVAAGLAWLAAHQDADGCFSASTFFVHDPKGQATDGPGGADQDTTVTALSLLAFLGAGHTGRHGDHQETVSRAVRWLVGHQQEDGMFGTGHLDHAVHAHALACFALAEAAGFDQDPEPADAAASGLRRLIALRLADGGWALGVDGKESEFDTTLTAQLALASAGFFNLPTADTTGLPDLLARLAAGRSTGGEAVARFFIGENEKGNERLRKLGEDLATSSPRWPSEGDAAGFDPLAWYHGAMAAYQFGGRTWKSWSERILGDLLAHQRQDGSFAGSWDPLGPRGRLLGRVGVTALMTLTLETYYRYTRIIR